MCKIVFSAIPTSREPREHEGKKGFPFPRITSHTDKHSQDPTQNETEKIAQRIDLYSYASYRKSKGKTDQKCVIKLRK